MTYVWVVESGEYEQRSVDFVASSLESAEAEIKARNPQVEQWEALKREDYSRSPELPEWIVYTLKGSTKRQREAHTGPRWVIDETEYSIQRYELK